MSSFPAKLMATIVAVLLLVCDFSATSASVPYGNYNFSLLSLLVWIGISSCNGRRCTELKSFTDFIIKCQGPWDLDMAEILLKF